MAQWWVKTRYINTTDDVLQCFRENNSFFQTQCKKFFGEFQNIRLKEYQYFYLLITLLEDLGP
jgi:hypothetical protein